MPRSPASSQPGRPKTTVERQARRRPNTLPARSGARLVWARTTAPPNVPAASQSAARTWKNRNQVAELMAILRGDRAALYHPAGTPRRRLESARPGARRARQGDRPHVEPPAPEVHLPRTRDRALRSPFGRGRADRPLARQPLLPAGGARPADGA